MAYICAGYRGVVLCKQADRPPRHLECVLLPQTHPPNYTERIIFDVLCSVDVVLTASWPHGYLLCVRLSALVLQRVHKGFTYNCTYALLHNDAVE